MRSSASRLAIVGVVSVLTLLLSGCFLRALAGNVALGEEEATAHIGATSITADCHESMLPGEEGFITCFYVIDFDPSFELETTVQLISEFGLFGVLIDPLILQIPEEAHGLVGTFNDGASFQLLDITVVDSFDVQPGVVVTAEPGHKFAILEFPSGTSYDGVEFDFDLFFQYPRVEPIPVKGMFAGRVETNGETFYVPLAPCTTDFASAPEITIPVAGSPQSLVPDLVSFLSSAGDIGCDGQVYDFRTGPAVIDVDIDIKPGSDPNSINCKNTRGTIPVAILTTPEFDATTVDHTTVLFEGAGEAHIDKKNGEPRRHEEDVDGDGDTDLVFHFRFKDTTLDCDSTEGVLTGETFNGQAVQGSDAVRMVNRG